MNKDAAMKKLSALKAILKQYKKVSVAFSGGVDSSFLLYIAYTVLGKENVIAVTADSESHPKKEIKEASGFTQKYGITHKIMTTCEIDVINKKGNPPDRCYFCKLALFRKLKKLIKEHGSGTIIEGSNKDDEYDFRPGSKAIKELQICSPLKEAGLTKEEIRIFSKEMGLPTWDKPASACLISRFPYHTIIEKKIVKKIEKAEEYLHELGFRQCRVRYFGNRISVEVEKNRVQEAFSIKEKIIEGLKKIGLNNSEIDPDGYRTGRMNLFIKNEK